MIDYITYAEGSIYSYGMLFRLSPQRLRRPATLQNAISPAHFLALRSYTVMFMILPAVRPPAEYICKLIYTLASRYLKRMGMF